jgi:hypothetical protein
VASWTAILKETHTRTTGFGPFLLRTPLRTSHYWFRRSYPGRGLRNVTLRFGRCSPWEEALSRSLRYPMSLNSLRIRAPNERPRNTFGDAVEVPVAVERRLECANVRRATIETPHAASACGLANHVCRAARLRLWWFWRGRGSDLIRLRRSASLWSQPFSLPTGILDAPPRFSRSMDRRRCHRTLTGCIISGMEHPTGATMDGATRGFCQPKPVALSG